MRNRERNSPFQRQRAQFDAGVGRRMRTIRRKGCPERFAQGATGASLTGGNLDTLGHEVLGVAGGLGVELAELLEVLELHEHEGGFRVSVGISWDIDR